MTSACLKDVNQQKTHLVDSIVKGCSFVILMIVFAYRYHWRSANDFKVTKFQLHKEKDWFRFSSSFISEGILSFRQYSEVRNMSKLVAGWP